MSLAYVHIYVSFIFTFILNIYLVFGFEFLPNCPHVPAATTEFHLHIHVCAIYLYLYFDRMHFPLCPRVTTMPIPHLTFMHLISCQQSIAGTAQPNMVLSSSPPPPPSSSAVNKVLQNCRARHGSLFSPQLQFPR